jgi:hypothetical protein
MSKAFPNKAHYALKSLENKGIVKHIISQNVDGLHQKAGSKNVIDLHGRLDKVKCMSCQEIVSRHDVQDFLSKENSNFVRDVINPIRESERNMSSHNAPVFTKQHADGDLDLGNNINLSNVCVISLVMNVVYCNAFLLLNCSSRYPHVQLVEAY